MNLLTIEDCNCILDAYHLGRAERMNCIDSSHGEEDIRQNYVLDNRYVIRVNNADVFDEKRFEELNRLIMRYREFGIEAPLFLKSRDGNYLGQAKGQTFYVSEYLDGLVPPEELAEETEARLVEERLELIAKFAEKYKGLDLSGNMSMYSLFDLSPYDMPAGIDEKQSNLNNLTHKLDDLGEKQLSDQIKQYDDHLRKELQAIYKSLPRCVFQGDENWGNLIVDEDYRIKGLFDFNMAGTDVIVNYFANNALLIPSAVNDDAFANHSTQETLDQLKEDFRQNTEILEKHYHFTEIEKQAYILYAKIAVLSIYPNECALEYWLDNPQTRPQALELLKSLTAPR